MWVNVNIRASRVHRVTRCSCNCNERLRTVTFSTPTATNAIGWSCTKCHHLIKSEQFILLHEEGVLFEPDGGRPEYEKQLELCLREER